MLREAVAYRVPELCLERAYLMAASYRETEGEPPVIRRAEALARVLKEMTIHIDDGELIVGKATSKRVAGPLLPEVQWQWYLDELDTISVREHEQFRAWTEKEKDRVKEALAYFDGKSLYDKWVSLLPDDFDRFQNQAWVPGGANPIVGIHMAHCCPGFERVLAGGMVNGLMQQVDAELEKLDLTSARDYEKSVFLRAVNIALAAVISFAGRYADLAQEMAGQEKDVQRKDDLERIAAICRWVPANTARSFREAMQSLWFLYLAIMLEGWGPGIGFGRIDQYLYPFYQKEWDEGRITREEARELIALFYIKLNELVMPFSSKNPSGTGQIPLSVITLGGIMPDGQSAVNELSYLFLEAEEDVRLQEDIAVRIHETTPEAFLIKVCEIARMVRGKIKFVSDETIVKQLLSDGKPLAYARDYAITGCFIHTVPGRSHDTGGDFLNLPLMLELALNNGVARLSGEQIGPEAGDPRKFTSYDELWQAYQRQVAALVSSRVVSTNLYRQLFAELLPTPLQSAFFDGCLETGTDITADGAAPYTTMAMWVCGIPNVGDALAAVKRVVFDRKLVSMSRLVDALDKNFAGEEEVRHLLTTVPKFGNDDDDVDSIVNDVLCQISRELAGHRCLGEIKYTTAAGAIASNVLLGRAVGALPDGRKAGEPLSEGGISPYQGRNVSGPTSTMRSVTKLDLIKASGGAVLNMRFNPDSLQGESGIRKFAAMLRTFCATGGDLVQFNIVSGDTLLDAQQHPERYRDLLVRVATYSAYFVDLPLELQNDIIARTEFRDF